MNNRMNTWVLVGCLLLGGALQDAGAAQSTLLPEPPALAAPSPDETASRTLNLAENLRCPVCQGQAVADSSAESALAMQGRIHELVADGYSDEQIQDYFVDLYGEWVLLQPPKRGMHWAIWFAPILLLVAGVLGWLRAGAKRRPPPNTPVESDGSGDDDPYTRRVLAELDESR